MSKSSDAWILASKYTAFGTKPASKLENNPKNNLDYVNKFLTPAAFMISGIPKEEFDFKKAGSCNNDALSYLSSLLSGSDINKMISIMNSIVPSPAWMLYLPDLVDLYKYNGNLSESLRQAVDAYMKTHKVAYGVCYADGTDIMVITDNDGNPIPAYPKSTVLYSEAYLKLHTIRHGTNTLSNLLHKEWWKYTKLDKELIASLEWIEAKDFAKFDIPIVTESGDVVIEPHSYLDDKLPPDEVLDLYSNLPKALVDESENIVAAAIKYCQNNADCLKSDKAQEYVSDVSKRISKSNTQSSKEYADVFAVELPDSKDGVDVEQQLKERGYKTRTFDEAIEDYMTSFGLDKNITVQQLIDYMNAPEDSENPVPFDKAKYDAEWQNTMNSAIEEALDAIDESAIVHRKLADAGVSEAVVDSIVNAIGSGDKVPDNITIVDDAAKRYIVTEALASVGLDDDTVSRIKLAMSTGSKADISAATYSDAYEKAGAYMLHGVREYLCKDEGWQIREELKDVMYAYFRLLMAADKERADIIQYVTEIGDKAPDKAKVIINGAMEVFKA